MSKPISIGNLTSQHLQVVETCLRRMLHPATRGAEWLLWRNDENELFFTDIAQAEAVRVMAMRPDLKINNYRHSPQYRVQPADIREDLEDALQRQAMTIADVAARHVAGRRVGVAG